MALKQHPTVACVLKIHQAVQADVKFFPKKLTPELFIAMLHSKSHHHEAVIGCEVFNEIALTRDLQCFHIVLCSGRVKFLASLVVEVDLKESGRDKSLCKEEGKQAIRKTIISAIRSPLPSRERGLLKFNQKVQIECMFPQKMHQFLNICFNNHSFSPTNELTLVFKKT